MERRWIWKQKFLKNLYTDKVPNLSGSFPNSGQQRVKFVSVFLPIFVPNFAASTHKMKVLILRVLCRIRDGPKVNFKRGSGNNYLQSMENKEWMNFSVLNKYSVQHCLSTLCESSTIGKQMLLLPWKQTSVKFNNVKQNTIDMSSQGLGRVKFKLTVIQKSLNNTIKLFVSSWFSWTTIPP